MIPIEVKTAALVIGVHLFAGLSQAHPPESNDALETGEAGALPTAMILPAIDGPTPWSDKPVLDDPNRFHIAIMTDRTGGHRPGIWMKAVDRVNLLRPDFVMSVGDLIEGYTENRQRLETEWKEFLGFVDQTEMKFFFVAGNHDVTNPTMHDIWRNHFGPEWYSFDYKGVHFVALCSEDPVSRVGDQQLAWLQKDLENNKDARWTLIFLHKPLWVYAERHAAAGNPDSTNWSQIAQAIGNRPHTVFAGHHHSYVQYERNGSKYYQLATTGGASGLRGPDYGEFDHITWLTMEKDGPHVSNLLLDGVLPADVVTEEKIGRFRSFLAETSIEIAPILIDNEAGFSEGRIDLRFTNNFDKKVRITGTFDGLPLRGLTVDPAKLTLEADPGKTAELSVRLAFTETMSFSHLAHTWFKAIVTTVDEDPPIRAEKTVPVVIDQKFPCPYRRQPVALDGKLNEWRDLSLTTGEKPLILGAAETWTGPSDATLLFATACDERFIYVAAHVKDDRVTEKDALDIRLDARRITSRKSDSRWRDGTYTFRVAIPENDGPANVTAKGYRKEKLPPGVQAAVTRSANGYAVELAIPVAILAKHQGKNWTTFQMTPIVIDVDDVSDKPARLIWRGTKDVDRQNTNFGHFVRTP